VSGPGDDLEARYAEWVAAASGAGQVWILVDEEDYNTVLEDDEAGRDLHMLFLTEADAAGKSEGTSPSPMDLEDLTELLGRIEERGEGLALSDGDGWIVAEPGLFAETLEGEGRAGD
jgi:hypothetical protein